MTPTPLLILSDSPLGPTGLGRITRELAERIHRDIPEVRVGVYGLGGTTSRHLPYPFYPVTQIQNYRVMELPRVWDDFAGPGERGVLFTIWNHTWCDWIVDPSLLQEGELQDFCANPPFRLWSYIPVDGVRADGTLPLRPTLERIQRPLAYTEFGAEAIGRTIGVTPDWLPHGTDDKTFYPRDKMEARKRFNIKPESFLIGVVATNTPRKDWPLAFATVAELRRQGVDAGLWAHTDVYWRGWNLPELAHIYGLDECWMRDTTHYDEDTMAWMYAACDVTLGIGLGEGWGFPLAESLACGVPVLTGDYAGATQFVPEWCRMPVEGWRTEGGAHSLLRPVFSAHNWVRQISEVCGMRERGESHLDSQYYWSNCWPKWKQWILEGL